MKTPIERIQGFACEVDEAQWKELVMVADEVKCNVGDWSRNNGVTQISFIATAGSGSLFLDNQVFTKESLIPYPGFLAKLKGEEKWEPKNGELVNGSMNGNSWSDDADEYITEYLGMHILKHMTVNGQWIACVWQHVRPSRPTMTRSEAEQKLNVRITD